MQLDYFKRLVCLCSEAAMADRERRNVFTIIIMERSLHSAHFVFSQLAYHRGYLTEAAYKTLTDIYRTTMDGYRHFPPLDGILYLKTSKQQVDRPPPEQI